MQNVYIRRMSVLLAKNQRLEVRCVTLMRDWAVSAYSGGLLDSASSHVPRTGRRDDRMVVPTLGISLQAESCLFLLEMPRSPKWPQNPGDMAWRRRISRYLYLRNLVLKTV